MTIKLNGFVFYDESDYISKEHKIMALRDLIEEAHEARNYSIGELFFKEIARLERGGVIPSFFGEGKCFSFFGVAYAWNGQKKNCR